MHDHDLDLIAEHASGLLTGADEARASALVGSCPLCAAEFAGQRQVRTLLAESPAPSLSDFERTRLRRAVLDGVAPAPRGGVDWRRRFLAVAGGVAAVAMFVVGIGVIGTLGDGDDDSVTMADGDTAATTGAQLRIPPPPEGGGDEAGAEVFSAEAEEALADDAGSEDTGEARFSANLLIDAGTVEQQGDLDGILAEMTAVVAETDDVVDSDDAVAFGATCAPVVAEEILAVVLVTIDDTPTQVFVTGLRDEPVVVMLEAGECTAPR